MARIRADYVFGTTDTSLAAGDTTLSSPTLSRLPAVTSPDVAAITLHDPATGVYEIVHVTAHTASATTATIARGQESSTAQTWASGTTWEHGPTASDLASGDPDAWQDYTPTLSATTTSPTLGTGATAAGRYVQSGTSVMGWALIAFGSSGVNPGSGAYEITLPVDVRPESFTPTALHGVVGSARLNDFGTANHVGVAVVPDGGTNKIRIFTSGSSVAQVAHNAPFTFAASDRIWVEFAYEAATSVGGGGGGGGSADLSSYARTAGTVSAPHVQLGPTTKTLNSGTGGTYSVLAFQNNDTAAPDDATRLYVVPRAKPATGVAGAVKVFGDPYFDGGDYRDLGIYHSADQNADTGHKGTGAFWINSKVSGASYADKNPDIGFSFQDGATVAGRFSYLASGQSVFVAGTEKPGISTLVPTVLRLEVQGDLGFDGTAGGKGIRWYRSAGNADNLMRFNTGNVQLIFAGAQRFLVDSTGGVIMGDGANRIATTSTSGFLYARAMAGTPTSTPTAVGGTVPLVVDDSGSKLWAYIGGAWKSVTFA